jgi:hypothetical protein
MVLSCSKDDYSSDNGADEEGQINLHVGEEDEPFVSGALLELACGFCATDAASWILSANTYSKLANYWM